MNITPPSIYLVGDQRLSTNLNSKATTLYYQLANQLATGSLSSLSRTVDLVDGIINIRVTRDLSYNSFISGTITITTKSVSGEKKSPFYVGTFSKITHNGTIEPAYAQCLLIPDGYTTPAGATSTIPYYLNQWTVDSSGKRFSYGDNLLGHRSPYTRIYAYHDSELTQIAEYTSCDDMTYDGSKFCYLVQDTDPWHIHEFKRESVITYNSYLYAGPRVSGSPDTIRAGFTDKSGNINNAYSECSLISPGFTINYTLTNGVTTSTGTFTPSEDAANGNYVNRLKGAVSRDGKKYVLGWRVYSYPHNFYALIIRLEYTSINNIPTISFEERFTGGSY